MIHLPNEIWVQIMWNLDQGEVAKLTRIKCLHEAAHEFLYKTDVERAQDPPLVVINNTLGEPQKGYHWGSQAMAWAIEKEDDALLERSLAYGGKRVINYKVRRPGTERGWSFATTLLYTAAARGLTHIVDRLVDNGADVDALTISWHSDNDASASLITPLGMALKSGHDMTARALLRRGAGLEVFWCIRKEPQCLKYTALMVATLHKNVQMMRELLDTYHADVNTVDKLGHTVLHMVYEEKRHDLLPILLAAGANAQAVNLRGETPLHFCTHFSSDIESIGLLIAAGADVNTQDNVGRTPLGAAGLSRNAGAIECLALTHEADLYLGSQNGQDVWSLLTATPYDEAEEHEKMRRCVKALIDAGITVDQGKMAAFLDHNCYQILVLLRDHLQESVTGNDWIPEYTSLADKNWENNKSIRFLLKYYPPPPLEAHRDHDDRWKQVFKNMYTGAAIFDVQLAQMLEQHVAPPNIIPGQKNISMHLLEKGSYDYHKHSHLLVGHFTHGIDPKARDEDGRTCLHYLASNTNINGESFQSTLTLLITNGIDVSAQDSHGNTALHNVIMVGGLEPTDVEKVTALIKSGSKMDLKNKNGNTPLDTARATHGPDTEVARLLS